jgi:hypothetical protein
MGPLSRLVTGVLVVLAVCAAFFFGLVVLLVLVGVVFLSALVFRLRAWWLRRAGGQVSPVSAGGIRSGQVIDAEYRVISRRRN